MIKTENDLMEALDRALPGGLTGELWEFLVDDLCVSGFFDEGEPEDDFNYVLARARRVMGVRSAKRAPDAPKMMDGSKKQQTAGRLRARQKALSILFAKEAAKDDRVIEFRRDVLGDSFPLPYEKVEEWIIGQHERDGGDEQVGFRYVVQRQQKGDAKQTEDIGGHVDTLAYGVPGDKWGRARAVVWGGVLDSLRRISESLSETFKWSEGEATVFILTDIPPMAALYHAGWGQPRPITSTTRIKLTLDPVLTEREVATVYRQIRHSMLKKDRQGRVRYHLPREKACELAIFNAQQPEDKTYREKMKTWNRTVAREHPGWKYKQESNFGKDCKAAKDNLFYPGCFD